MEDEHIIRQILAGDQQAFRQLIHQYHRYLYSVIFAVVPHPDDTEDLVQEVFLRIYVSLPQYEMRGFKTWITRIAVNRAIDFKRKKLTGKEILYDSLDDHVMTTNLVDDHAFWQKEQHALVRERIKQMPEHYGRVISAFYLEGLSYQEIADRTGLKRKTVEMQLYRAKHWIHKHWKEEDFR